MYSYVSPLVSVLHVQTLLSLSLNLRILKLERSSRGRVARAQRFTVRPPTSPTLGFHKEGHQVSVEVVFPAIAQRHMHVQPRVVKNIVTGLLLLKVARH